MIGETISISYRQPTFDRELGLASAIYYSYNVPIEVWEENKDNYQRHNTTILNQKDWSDLMTKTTRHFIVKIINTAHAN